MSEGAEPTGKGRPTPKRSEARRRRRTAAPTNRKEAAALRRQKVREQRSLQRQALQTGDERYLPPRDAGPAKKLAREYVDSRFTLGQIFFGMVIVLFVFGFVGNRSLQAVVNLLLLLMFFGVLVDAIRIGRGARREVETKYGVKESTGIVAYAMLRAMQPRRMRRPPAPRKSAA